VVAMHYCTHLSIRGMESWRGECAAGLLVEMEKQVLLTYANIVWLVVDWILHA
jgi:hypothetical protein